MFVVHAIILTFITTPLTLLFYPAKYRVREGTADAPAKEKDGDAEVTPRKSVGDDEIRTKFAMILDKIEQIPAAMTLSQLLQPLNVSTAVEGRDSPFSEEPPPYISIDALRLIELTHRTSAVFKSQEADSLIHNDPVVSVFRTFGYLNRLVVSASLSVVNHEEFPTAIATHVKDSGSQMVVLPWARGATTVSDELASTGGARNPFDGIFHKTTTSDQTSSVVYSEYIRQVFLTAPSDVALFVDRGGPSHYTGHADQHLFLPFFGGPDDRLALNFLVQLCANPSVKATVVRIRKADSDTASVRSDVKGVPHTVRAPLSFLSDAPYS
jgi:hypothetical protein